MCWAEVKGVWGRSRSVFSPCLFNNVKLWTEEIAICNKEWCLQCFSRRTITQFREVAAPHDFYISFQSELISGGFLLLKKRNFCELKNIMGMSLFGCFWAFLKKGSFTLIWKLWSVRKRNRQFSSTPFTKNPPRGSLLCFKLWESLSVSDALLQILFLRLPHVECVIYENW